jgi:hypothetical protein
MGTGSTFSRVTVSSSASSTWSMNDQEQVKTILQKQLKAIAKLQGKQKRAEKKHHASKERMAELKQKVESLEAEIEDLEEQLAGAQSKGQFLSSNFALKGKDTESQRDMQKRENDRQRAQLYGDAMDDFDEDFEDEFIGTVRSGALLDMIKTTRRKWKEFLAWLDPLDEDIKHVEARYGASVAAYFKFYSWIFELYSFLGLCLCPLYFYHWLGFIQNGKVAEILQPPNIADSGGFFLLPWGAQFASFGHDDAFAYSTAILSFQFLLVIIIIRKWVREDYRAKIGRIDGGQANKFPKLTLAVWDCSVHKPSEVMDLKMQITGDLALKLYEEKTRDKVQSRTTSQKVLLYTRRAIGMLLYFGIQVLGWMIILYLTAESTNLQEQASEMYPFLASFSRALVPASVSVINAILPTLLQVITVFEQWSDEGVILKLTVSRLFLARMFNVLIQVFSFLLLLDPLWLATNEFYIPFTGQTLSSEVLQFRVWARKDFEQDSSFVCPAHQTGEGLFTLIVTEFIFGKVIMLGQPIAKFLQAKVLRKAPQKIEFKVGVIVVNFYYFQALLLMCVPVAPFIAILAPLMFMLNFKFEVKFLHYFQRKPQKPWAAKDAELFFVKFAFATAVLGMSFNHMFLRNSTFPKDCSLQDSHIQLCLPDTYNANTNLCMVDEEMAIASTNEALLDYWALEGTDEYGCLNATTAAYPKCICQYQCGPFSQYKNGYTALMDWVEEKVVFRPFLPLVNPGGMIGLSLAFFLFAIITCRSNSVNVLHTSYGSETDELRVLIRILERKVKRQEKQIETSKKLTKIHIATSG